MMKIFHSFKDIKNSNAVFFLQDVAEIEKLNFLGLDEKILKKLKKSFTEKKDEFYTFFVGHPKFENVYIFISSEKDVQKNVDFI